MLSLSRDGFGNADDDVPTRLEATVACPEVINLDHRIDPLINIILCRNSIRLRE